jgi:hypothetical protein
MKVKYQVEKKEGRREEENKRDLKETVCEGVYWINLAHRTDLWTVVVNMTMKCRVW